MGHPLPYFYLVARVAVGELLFFALIREENTLDGVYNGKCFCDRHVVQKKYNLIHTPE